MLSRMRNPQLENLASQAPYLSSCVVCKLCSLPVSVYVHEITWRINQPANESLSTIYAFTFRNFAVALHSMKLDDVTKRAFHKAEV